MDNLQDYLVANLPPGLLDHITNHGSTYWALYQRFLAFRRAFDQQLLTPLTTYIVQPFVSRITSSPDFATIILLLVVLILSLKMLDMLVRTVMWWIRLVTRLMFWSLILGAVVWLWQRGLDGAVKDFDAWRHIWSQNYEYWQRQELNYRRTNGEPFRNNHGGPWTR